MCCPLHWLAKVFAAVGAINWGLVALLRFNLVEFIHKFLPIPYLNIIVYSIVAASGVIVLLSLCMPKACKPCKK